MATRWFCADHAARHNQLVGATALADGRTLCAEHARSSDTDPTPLRPKARIPDCQQCLQRTHRAYFMVDRQPLCIRHAADAMFPDDDMGAHDMQHAAYLTLGAAGVRDAY